MCGAMRRAFREEASLVRISRIYRRKGGRVYVEYRMQAPYGARRAIAIPVASVSGLPLRFASAYLLLVDPEVSDQTINAVVRSLRRRFMVVLKLVGDADGSR